MENNKATGHLTAIFTIFIWGITFISTKVLLDKFAPIEILFFRFAIALAALIIIYPHRLRLKDKKQEILFMGAGICGVTLYYLLENIALTYTMASNVAVILSAAPFFTAMFTHIFRKKEKLYINFFIGFVLAMAGICLISFNGSRLHLNPLGDLLALGAAIVWAAYSVITRKISDYGYNTIQTTRRIFIYGLLFMVPVLAASDFSFNLSRFSDKICLFNILFLGLGASAVCFVTWNFTLKVLGAVKTSVYIYLTPVVTIIASFIFLDEKLTYISFAGTVLTLTGLILSERK